jgi:hypothetical protein
MIKLSFSFLCQKDILEMASSDTSTTRPIFLIPTEHSNAVNGESVVVVKNVSQTNENISFNEQVYSTFQAIGEEARALFRFHPKEWISAFKPNPKFPLFVLGDIDGFVALFMNNLATLLAVILGLRIVLEDDIIYGKIVPG